MTQVITIAPNGALSGLQVKPGKGLNLQSMGHAQTVRASEIIWEPNNQAWYIDVLQDAGKGVVTGGKLIEVMDDKTLVALLADTNARVHEDARAPVMFDSYDDAVKVEIAYLDALRIKGIF